MHENPPVFALFRCESCWVLYGVPISQVYLIPSPWRCSGCRGKVVEFTPFNLSYCGEPGPDA